MTMLGILYFCMLLIPRKPLDILLISAMIMLHQALAYSMSNAYEGNLINDSQLPCLSSERAAEICHAAVLRMTNVARLLDEPSYLARTSPLVPLCMFVVGRYLIVTKSLYWEPANHVNAIKRGLTHLAKLFPVAGKSIVVTNKNDIIWHWCRLNYSLLIKWHCTRNFRNHHLRTLYYPCSYGNHHTSTLFRFSLSHLGLKMLKSSCRYNTSTIRSSIALRCRVEIRSPSC
jgi:hypothetical protein